MSYKASYTARRRYGVGAVVAVKSLPVVRRRRLVVSVVRALIVDLLRDAARAAGVDPQRDVVTHAEHGDDDQLHQHGDATDARRRSGRTATQQTPTTSVNVWSVSSAGGVAAAGGAAGPPPY